jgi:hypothetical protein
MKGHDMALGLKYLYWMCRQCLVSQHTEIKCKGSTVMSTLRERMTNYVYKGSISLSLCLSLSLSLCISFFLISLFDQHVTTIYHLTFCPFIYLPFILHIDLVEAVLIQPRYTSLPSTSCKNILVRFPWASIPFRALRCKRHWNTNVSHPLVAEALNILLFISCSFSTLLLSF